MNPTATVVVEMRYRTYGKDKYSEFPVVSVKFVSGSYIDFELGPGYGKERVYKIFDKVSNVETVERTLERFQEQVSL